MPTPQKLSSTLGCGILIETIGGMIFFLIGGFLCVLWERAEVEVKQSEAEVRRREAEEAKKVLKNPQSSP